MSAVTAFLTSIVSISADSYTSHVFFGEGYKRLMTLLNGGFIPIQIASRILACKEGDNFALRQESAFDVMAHPTYKFLVPFCRACRYRIQYQVPEPVQIHL